MRIGLIDIDSHNYPNLVLMKLSAWHKMFGDEVEGYDPMFGGWYDRVYASKVFSFSKDYQYPINADEVVYGGTGYAIKLKNGKEVFDKTLNTVLPYSVEQRKPDTSIYEGKIKDVTNTAYGFLTRGCPRGCEFCHVAPKEGKCSYKVANLSEFGDCEKYIEILDPNILACNQREGLLAQLAISGAKVNFNQGLDVRLLSEGICLLIKDINLSMVHFAWDNYEDGPQILPKLQMFKEITGINGRNIVVYVLTNFNTTFEQDLERITRLREIGVSPYTMIYDKEHLAPKHQLKRLQRWTNNRFLWHACKSFDEYKER